MKHNTLIQRVSAKQKAFANDNKLFDCAIIELTRLDPQCSFDRPDEDFAVTRITGMRGTGDCLDNQINHLVKRGDLEPFLLDVFDDVFRCTVWSAKSMHSFLAPETLHIRQRHSWKALDLFERSGDFAQHEWLDDCNNDLHWSYCA